VIKTTGQVIHLGPEGSHAGGNVPEDIAACKTCHTGRFLKANLRA
jgi:excinuclease ABC subunit A